MTIDELLKDKEVKSKEKTEKLSKWLIEKSLPIDELLAFAEKQKESVKATCIEAMEYATQQHPEIADESALVFVTQMLTAKAPRVKWESAKVIGNIAHLFSDKLEAPIANLLVNTEHEGTVVRWSAAFALSQILKLETSNNKGLISAIVAICEKGEKKSIQKIYLDALKKLKK